MERQDETSFCERFQDACPEKVSQLRHSIRQDVKQTDGEIVNLKTYNRFLTAFIQMIKLPVEFVHMFKDKYVDIDMQDDLERTEIINWCRTTKPVLALRTTADGNCLLHAISQGLWGIEDTELFLRRLLYVNLATDTKGSLRRRWMFHHKNSSDLNRVDVRLNTVECSEEWDSVIKATDDLGQEQNHGLPYTSLESIHLYVLANILRRPIIVLADTMARTVYGETIQDSQINGIYLPLEWPAEQCDKNPLILGYNMNHFAPLLFEDEVAQNQGDAAIRAIPLVTKDMDSIPARYLMPNEEANYINILRDYVNTTEVFHGITSIPAAKVNLVPLNHTVNVVDACRKDCEKKFRRLLGPESQQAAVPPFNFQTELREPKSPRREFAEHQNKKRKECATIGCKHFANPETQNLCSKCFNDFTIQYARQEEVARKMTAEQQNRLSRKAPIRQTQVPGSVPVRQGSRPEDFHDLSMMGEDCHAGCGFKCSTETYPYCHECHPKFVGTATATHKPQHTVPPKQPMQQDFSIMPEDCHNPSCSYRCSKATYPYCHNCYPIFIGSAHASPSAPPPSFHETTGVNPTQEQVLQDVQMGIQSSDETAVVSGNRMPLVGNKKPVHIPVTPYVGLERQTEPMDVQSGSGALDKKCVTVNCNENAVRGNNGYCETCYQVTMFGAGTSPAVTCCKTPGCNENITVPEATQCVSCFLKGDSSRCKSLTGSGTQAVGMNIAPTLEEKILNERPGEKNHVFSLSGASMRSVPMEHDETAAHVIAPVITKLQAEQEEKYQVEQPRKYICATAGCDGIRIDNEQGLCHTCMNNNPGGETAGTQPPSGSNLNESQAYPSCSPIAPTKEEMKKLNPVVVSSRDKIKCASPSCSTLIYPPKKLCDECSAVLQQFQAKKTKEDNRRSVGGAGTECKTLGCTFFGSPEFNGFCSSCFKAQVPARHTAPLISKSRASTNTAPIIPVGQQVQSRQTVPLVAHKAKLCIEKDCTRYGDPSQLDRCSYHYEQATTQYVPLSPASLEQQRQILVGQHQQQVRLPIQSRITFANPSETGRDKRNHRPEVVPAELHGGATVNEHAINGDDQFGISYNRLIDSKKIKSYCKNNNKTGCTNYGNSAKGGLCNTCYSRQQGMSAR